MTLFLLLCFFQGAKSGLLVRPLPESRAEYKNRLEQSYGVFVGVEQFDDGSFSALKYAADDAIALREAFVDELRLLKRENTRLLVSDSPKKEEQPTKNNILKAVKWAADNAGPQGCVVVCYSSHGLNAYLLAKDSDLQLLEDSTVPLERLKQLLSEADAQRRLLLLDACRENPQKGVKGMTGAASAAFASAFEGAKGFYVLQATEKGSYSYEDDMLKQGVLTHYFLEGVRGQAPANAEGLITLNGVVNWARTKVEDATRLRPQGKQSPRLSHLDGAGEFPLAEVIIGDDDHDDEVVIEEVYGGLEIYLDGGGWIRLAGPGGVRKYELKPTERLKHEKLLVGAYRIEVGREGYESQEERVQIEWDKGLRRSYSLKKKETKPEERQAGARKELEIKGVSFAFRWCPPGRFLMGSPASEPDRDDDESQHEVVLSRGYWLMETELTQRQWTALMVTNPSDFKGEDRPVEQVSWEDAQAFIRAANAALGGGLRLPTEAEWEYACRAGTTGAYAGSLARMGWYGVNAGRETHPVGQKEANAWGLFDMHGNVWEWCSDWYEAYPGGKTQDPVGPSTGQFRVNRGGSWGLSAGNCRSANRDCNRPTFRYRGLGFRLALGQP